MMSLEQARELWIQGCFVRDAQRQIASPGKGQQRRKYTRLITPLSRRQQLGDDLPAIGNQHGLAGPNFPNVLA
jgi:hypothetical protein